MKEHPSIRRQKNESPRAWLQAALHVWSCLNPANRTRLSILDQCRIFPMGDCYSYRLRSARSLRAGNRDLFKLITTLAVPSDSATSLGRGHSVQLTGHANNK